MLDFNEMQDNPEFWREVQERVIAEAIPEGWLFDTLIVDEGQDFAPGWYDILGLFLRKGSDVLRGNRPRV